MLIVYSFSCSSSNTPTKVIVWPEVEVLWADHLCPIFNISTIIDWSQSTVFALASYSSTFQNFSTLNGPTCRLWLCTSSNVLLCWVAISLQYNTWVKELTLRRWRQMWRRDLFWCRWGLGRATSVHACIDWICIPGWENMTFSRRWESFAQPGAMSNLRLLDPNTLSPSKCRMQVIKFSPLGSLLTAISRALGFLVCIDFRSRSSSKSSPTLLKAYPCR